MRVICALPLQCCIARLVCSQRHGRFTPASRLISDDSEILKPSISLGFSASHQRSSGIHVVPVDYAPAL